MNIESTDHFERVAELLLEELGDVIRRHKSARGDVRQRLREDLAAQLTPLLWQTAALSAVVMSKESYLAVCDNLFDKAKPCVDAGMSMRSILSLVGKIEGQA